MNRWLTVVASLLLPGQAPAGPAEGAPRPAPARPERAGLHRFLGRFDALPLPFEVKGGGTRLTLAEIDEFLARPATDTGRFDVVAYSRDGRFDVQVVGRVPLTGGGTALLLKAHEVGGIKGEDEHRLIAYSADGALVASEVLVRTVGEDGQRHRDSARIAQDLTIECRSQREVVLGLSAEWMTVMEAKAWTLRLMPDGHVERGPDRYLWPDGNFLEPRGEAFVIQGPWRGMRVLYLGARQPTPVEMQVRKVDADSRQVTVSFPKSRQSYLLTLDEPMASLTCRGPDGKERRFAR